MPACYVLGKATLVAKRGAREYSSYNNHCVHMCQLTVYAGHGTAAPGFNQQASGVYGSQPVVTQPLGYGASPTYGANQGYQASQGYSTQQPSNASAGAGGYGQSMGRATIPVQQSAPVVQQTYSQGAGRAAYAQQVCPKDSFLAVLPGCGMDRLAWTLRQRICLLQALEGSKDSCMGCICQANSQTLEKHHQHNSKQLWHSVIRITFQRGC